jgi:hypothetical protein
MDRQAESFDNIKRVGQFAADGTKVTFEANVDARRANQQGRPSIMAKYTFVVLTNPTSGKEAEYNEWYNKQHIPDVLNVPGFVAAQRFRLADAQMGDNNPHRYLALYEIETNDLAATLKDMQSRVGSNDMIMSDAIDMKTVAPHLFTPVAEKVQAKDVLRPRRAA